MIFVVDKTCIRKKNMKKNIKKIVSKPKKRNSKDKKKKNKKLIKKKKESSVTYSVNDGVSTFTIVRMSEVGVAPI